MRSADAVYPSLLPPLETLSCLISRHKYDIYVISMSFLCHYAILQSIDNKIFNTKICHMSLSFVIFDIVII